MLYCALLRFFAKREGKIHSKKLHRSYLSFPRIQHKVNCSSCIANCIRNRLRITHFLQLKLWARIPLQIGDSPSVVVLYLCVNFHNCVSVAFLRFNLTSYLCSEFYGHD